MRSILSSLRFVKRNSLDILQTLRYLCHCNPRAIALTKRLPHVHYICHGNICRSAFAEKYSKAFAKTHGISMVFTSSGLTANQANQPPQEALQAANEFSIELAHHLPLRTSTGLLSRADLIIGMHTIHSFRFRKSFPQYAGSFYLLKHLVFPKYWQFNIHDPFNHDPEVYDQCFNEIKTCLDVLLPCWAGSQ